MYDKFNDKFMLNIVIFFILNRIIKGILNNYIIIIK